MLPETAPFPAEQIVALNSIISGTSAEQRTWLSGFLAGYQAATTPQPAAAAPPARRAPLTILFATESGNAEALAGAARKAAGKLGFAARVLDMADTTPAQVAGAQNLLVIASTWGEGDPPQRAIDFHAALMADDAPRFDGVRYAVLALGDRAYAKFCETGRLFDERFAALGATRVADRIECDSTTRRPPPAGSTPPWARCRPSWASRKRAPSSMSILRAPGGLAPGAARDRSRRRSPSASGSPAADPLPTPGMWSCRSRARASTYEPGDSLGFLPGNDPGAGRRSAGGVGVVRERAASFAAAGAVRHHDVDRTARRRPDGWQVIDMLEAAPHKLTAEQLLSLLRPLAPRYYSIASSRKAVPDEAHLLIAAVRYETHGRERKGVASVDVAERRKAGDRMSVFLKPNAHFRLPADPERPIIMIGPGTGIAPFRAFMQERDAVGAHGRNWLVFGHRNYTHDFLYQLEWQDLLKRGVLTRLDVAFSRDQPEKRYVQHALWDARRDLYAWLQEGAAIYVCGDANAMAKDVHATLQRDLGEQGDRDGVAGARCAAPRRQLSARCLLMARETQPPSPNEGDQGEQPLPARHHRRRPARAWKPARCRTTTSS